MNIIKRELRANLKSLLIWCGAMVVIIFMMMTEFEAYYDNPEMANVLDAMPEALMTAFSMTGANLTTLGGFISMASIYFYLMLTIFAVLLGSSIISKEERDKTAEFFLTMPVSRPKVMISKLIAAVINCLIFNLVTGAAILASGAPYSPDSDFFSFLRLLLSALFILQLVFLSIGVFLASVVKRYKKSGYYSIAVLMVTYIVSIIVGLTDKLDFLKLVTPFKYFEANYLLLKGQFEVKYLIISLCIIAAGTAGAFIVYPRRDLHI